MCSPRSYACVITGNSGALCCVLIVFSVCASSAHCRAGRFGSPRSVTCGYGVRHTREIR